MSPDRNAEERNAEEGNTEESERLDRRLVPNAILLL
jgi:hypothetical protein